MELSPTRHWSVERHIKRKHAGVGEPISINTHQTRTQMNIQSGWSNIPGPINTMEFTHEANKLQRDSNTTAITIITLKVIIILTHIKKYPENNTIHSANASDYDNEKTKRGFLSQPTKYRSVIDDETLQLLHQIS